ncbi:MAG: superoxide dismutase [Syntrophobacteraceae bacterium CG23_combo_of_CG06-09_8_20_14_all_50_8]|nr:MAG: superoxide dismutase [Syntrophobacteraceae bacterium CG23_combo_of_CG06-09_8_20_14_all_50_8]
MQETKFYTQPPLSYDYKALAPYISEEQLKIHYEKHHQAYIKGANAIFEKLDKARKEQADMDIKSTLKELSFNIGGHLLHSLFWGNLAPSGQYDKPAGILGNVISNEFGSLERFKKEFTQAALSVEGSGWAALTYCRQTQRPIIMQIEKHNMNVYPMFRILLVLDVFEHAYYIDYKNDRARFVDAFWSIVNWNEAGKRLEEIMEGMKSKA